MTPRNHDSHRAGATSLCVETRVRKEKIREAQTPKSNGSTFHHVRRVLPWSVFHMDPIKSGQAEASSHRRDPSATFCTRARHRVRIIPRRRHRSRNREESNLL